MTKTIKMIIIELVLLLIIGISIYAIFTVNLDLGIIKFASVNSVVTKHMDIEKANQKLLNIKSDYQKSLNILNSVKEEYKTQKEKYEAITDDTLNTIKEATTKEEFDIEYMWVKLGNYAKVNNLSIYLVEPGGTSTSEGSSNTNTDNSQVTGTTSGENTTSGSANNNTNSNSTTTNNELSIKIIGSYINLAEFVFDVENDVELRFKLDKINMVASEGTNVVATFVVKELVFKK